MASHRIIVELSGSNPAQLQDVPESVEPGDTLTIEVRDYDPPVECADDLTEGEDGASYYVDDRASVSVGVNVSPSTRPSVGKGGVTVAHPLNEYRAGRRRELVRWAMDLWEAYDLSLAQPDPANPSADSLCSAYFTWSEDAARFVGSCRHKGYTTWQPTQEGAYWVVHFIAPGI